MYKTAMCYILTMLRVFYSSYYIISDLIYSNSTLLNYISCTCIEVVFN